MYFEYMQFTAIPLVLNKGWAVLLTIIINKYSPPPTSLKV